MRHTPDIAIPYILSQKMTNGQRDVSLLVRADNQMPHLIAVSPQVADKEELFFHRSSIALMRAQAQKGFQFDVVQTEAKQNDDDDEQEAGSELDYDNLFDLYTTEEPNTMMIGMAARCRVRYIVFQGQQNNEFYYIDPKKHLIKDNAVLLEKDIKSRMQTKLESYNNENINDIPQLHKPYPSAGIHRHQYEVHSGWNNDTSTDDIPLLEKIYVLFLYKLLHERILLRQVQDLRSENDGSNIAAVLISPRGRVLSYALNTNAVDSNKENITHHAETLCLMNYLSRLLEPRTNESMAKSATLITTLEPCEMCAGCLVDFSNEFNMKLRVVYAMSDPRYSGDDKRRSTVLSESKENADCYQKALDFQSADFTLKQDLPSKIGSKQKTTEMFSALITSSLSESKDNDEFPTRKEAMKYYMQSPEVVNSDNKADLAARMKKFYDIMSKFFKAKPKKIKKTKLPIAAIKLLHTKEAEDVIQHFAGEFTKLKQALLSLNHDFQYRHDLKKIYQELEKLIQLEHEYNFNVWVERPLQQVRSQFIKVHDEQNEEELQTTSEFIFTPGQPTEEKSEPNGGSYSTGTKFILSAGVITIAYIIFNIYKNYKDQTSNQQRENATQEKDHSISGLLFKK